MKKSKRCRACNGKGVLIIAGRAGSGPIVNHSMRCAACFGTGKKDAKPPVRKVDPGEVRAVGVQASAP